MYKKKIKISFFVFTCVLGLIFFRSVYFGYGPKLAMRTISSLPSVPQDYYLKDVKPILDYRCVVCHSCYNAPCQLKLSSYEGVIRGANKNNINDIRVNEVAPTRLYTDAITSIQWRQKGFFPVVNENEEDGNQNLDLDSSLLYKMITLNRGQRNLSEKAFHSTESKSCSSNENEFQEYAQQNPNGGMPFGFPELNSSEYHKLEEWLTLGAPGPSGPSEKLLNTASRPEVIKKWEEFFNRADDNSRLVSRYIYEHLFLAHIYFKEMPNEYFVLVRSKTAFPNPIIEVPTKHPYDEAKGFTTYRLRKNKETIVHKTHMIYELSDKKMERYHELFSQNNWKAGSDAFYYQKETDSNPFAAFKKIPAKSRYQFLLDNAKYYIMSFTKGPVCKGSVALNVINDQTWAFFLKPDSDLSVTDPQYLETAYKYLDHPAKSDEDTYYYNYKLKQIEYTKFRKKMYDEKFARGMRLEDIWNGDGTNRGAVLTILRHDDSANVEEGAWGGIPKTALVLDYPILERIYYSLVAGFNPFGGVKHQVSTRLYMDNLRIEGEDLFLSFLPKKPARKLRDSWYEGTIARAKMYVMNAYSGISQKTEIVYKTEDPKKEFLKKILDEYLDPKVRGVVDDINCCDSVPEDNRKISSSIKTNRGLDLEIKKIVNTSAPFVQYFPEFSLLRVKKSNGEKDIIYSIIKNVDYANISFAIPGDSMRERIPENETIFFLKGFHGSYPNFFFVVDFDKMPDFLQRIQSLPKKTRYGFDDADSKKAFADFINSYGVLRSNPNFWQNSDWFNNQFFQEFPTEAGILDLNRYKNILLED